MASSSYIFNGIWYDHATRSHVITLSGTNAVILQAAIPIFVTFVGAQTWQLWRALFYRFYFHRNPATGTPAAATFYGARDQRRVLIRNSAGGLPLIGNIISWYRAWRKHSRMHRTPGTPPAVPVLAIIVGLFHFLLWIVLGILTGYIWAPPQGSDLGHARASNCGFVTLDNSYSAQETLLYETIDVNQTIDADQYVKQCYIDDPSPTAPCRFLPSRRIEFNRSDAACPFVDPDICLSTNSTPYVLDTGYIHSNYDLGIDLGDEGSVLFRRMSTCSPITSVNNAAIVPVNQTQNPSLWPPNSTLYRYFFGPILGQGSFNSTWTYQFNDWKPSDGYIYDLNAFGFFASAPLPVWLPNSTFWDAKSPVADVALFFLNGDHTVYQYPNYDPFFVTGASYTETVNNVNITAWTPGFYVNVLACTDSYQLCPADKSREYCSAPAGIYETGLQIHNLGFNEAQVATAQRITNQGFFLSTYYAAQSRGGASLLASLSVVDTLQTKALSNTQWRDEVAHWFSISLAKLQQAVVAFATGPSEPSLIQYVQRPFTGIGSMLAEQCHVQKVFLPGGTSNFNFLAIMILIGVGVPLWAISTWFDLFLERYWDWRKKDEMALMWELDEPCQIQRLGYKAAGYGDWDTTTAKKAIPTWREIAGTGPPNIDHAAHPPVLIKAPAGPVPLANIQPPQQGMHGARPPPAAGLPNPAAAPGAHHQQHPAPNNPNAAPPPAPSGGVAPRPGTTAAPANPTHHTTTPAAPSTGPNTNPAVHQQPGQGTGL